MVFKSNELDFLVLQNGKDGNPANSYYTWVKYSSNADGSNLTDDPTNAIYIGIAYNKESSKESNVASDYTWTKIKGENGTDAFTIILSNESVSFAVTNTNNLALSDQEFTCDVQVMQGTVERTDFTIGEVVSANGITITKTGTTIKLSVEKDSAITGSNGSFVIPVSIDGLALVKTISWSISKQGDKGEQGNEGISPINISVQNESQNIACDSDGNVLVQQLINIPFVGYKGMDQVPCTAVVGTLPSGITLGQNTACTDTKSGLIILNVAKGATLGNSSVMSGDISISFTIEERTMSKKFTWTKTLQGADGTPARMYELLPSTQIIKKKYVDTESFSPKFITFNSYYHDGDSVERLEYLGRFIISESTDNATYSNKYVSNADESVVSYTPSSSKVQSIKCILCSSGSITNQLDSQIIIILADTDDLKSDITSVKESVSSVKLLVDQNTKTISQKASQSDITTAIDNYDGSTVKTIRDQVSQHTTKIGGIESSVSDVQTQLTKKADGSTVQTLTDRVTKAEQDASGFKQKVEETYTTKDDLSQQSTTLKSEFSQRADEIKQEITDAKGSSTTLKTRLEGIDSSVVDAESNAKSFAIQEANRIKSIVTQDYTDYVNNIQVGGRNLIPNSNFLTGKVYPMVSAGATIGVTSADSISKGYKCLVLNQTGSGGVNMRTYVGLGAFSHSVGVQYTVSFMAKSQSENATLQVNVAGGSNPKNFSINATEWTKCVHTYTANNSGSLTFWLVDSGIAYITNIKLELGNKATDWTPAPEDVDTKISMVQSEFSQRAGEIEMSVSSKQDIGKTAIRYIRDWLDGSNKNSDNIWVECKVISQNLKDSSSINLAEGKIPVCKNSSLESVLITDIGVYTDSRLLEDETDKYVKGTGQRQCLQIDLGAVHYDIDYIQIWHYYKDNRIFKHSLQVSEDGSSWVTIYDSNVSGGYKETSDGFIHVINSSYITTNMTKLNVTSNSLKGQLSNIDGRVTEVVADIDGIRNIVTNDRTYAEGIEELLNKLKGDFNEKVESDAVFVSKTNQALDGLSDTYVKKTDYKTDIANLLQSATGWEWLFAQLGMYDVPSVQTNVKIDINGITVTNPTTGQITKMRIDGFSGWNNDDKIFWIEGDTTKTRRLLCEKGWDTDVIKMTTNTFSISENGNVTKLRGVSFVKSGGTS